MLLNCVCNLHHIAIHQNTAVQMVTEISETAMTELLILNKINN